MRRIEAADGREVLQMRVDLGLLQIEMEGRPDGSRPHGAETFLDYLVNLAICDGEAFQLTENDCVEVDREFMQFYNRRTCWLALNEYRLAVRDADHNLALMDFVAAHAADKSWLEAHEQYRPFILFQRTQAAALDELEHGGAESAIEQFNEGIDRLRGCLQPGENESEEDEPQHEEIVTRLIEIREAMRKQYDVGQTLSEQLDEAVALEQYELAANLRDQIARRGNDQHD